MCIFSRSMFGCRRELFPLEIFIESAEREPAIEPDLPIVDPHHHLFDARCDDKGWPVSDLMIKFLYFLKPTIAARVIGSSLDERVIRTVSHLMPAIVPYMENGLLRDISNARHQGDGPMTDDESDLPAHNVIATVCVESGWDDPKATSHAMKAVPEVAMAQGVADRTNNRLCTGIVGHVPLSEGGEPVRAALQKMMECSPNFRGIRDELACRKDLYPLESKHYSERKAYGAKFREGFAVLKEFGLTYDTWLYPNGLGMLRDLALHFPGVTIICDHMASPVGLPPSSPELALEEWKPMIKDLATSCPNFHVKLSGLGMAYAGFGFEKRNKPPNSKELAEAYGPFILHSIECFGVNRCMFASNFPMDKVSSGYTQLFNAFKLIVADFSDEDKRKLFCDNAKRVYKLDI